MKTNYTILIYTFFISLLFVACEKDTNYELLTGQLIGYVSLYDSENNKLSDKSGVEVIVEGSTPQIQTSTDENGQFIIDNLESGIYNLLFNKEGYGEYKEVSYQFVGGSKPVVLKPILYGLSNVQIDNVQITKDEWGWQDYNALNVDIKMSDPIENRYSYFRYYIGNEPDISYKNYISTDRFFNDYYREVLSFSIFVDTLKFPVGSELYLIMYPEASNSNYYIDIDTGNKIYTTINTNNASGVASITIPK